MPDPFGSISSSIQAGTAQRNNNRAALQAAREQAIMQRMMLQQALIGNRAQTGPAMMNARRLSQKSTAQQGQDKALVSYVMSLDPAKVEPQWRYSLGRIQDAIKADPTKAIDVAKIFTSKYRPAGLQFKTVQTMEDDGSGNMVPVTSFVVADPMSGSLGPAGMSPGLSGSSMPGSGGGRSSSSSMGGGLSTSAAALAKKYGLGGTAP